MIQVFDPTTGVTYEIEAIDYDLKSNPEAVRRDGAQPVRASEPAPAALSLPLRPYDTTGAVAEPGSYAFLADPADTASAVTTYEGLRDGSATALRIHETDADGVSRAAFLDTVEAGDTFEWKEADDCFVRYTVTAVKPDPAGTVPRKSLGVESIAYAFTGCSGAIATGSASGSAANSASSSTASVTWGALPNLGGTSLTVPIVQGPFQLVPAGWTGATKPVGPRFPAGPTIPFAETTSLAEARTLPHWREPELPEGWTFTYAWSGDEVEVGYFEAFYNGLTPHRLRLRNQREVLAKGGQRDLHQRRQPDQRPRDAADRGPARAGAPQHHRRGSSPRRFMSGTRRRACFTRSTGVATQRS